MRPARQILLATLGLTLPALLSGCAGMWSWNAKSQAIDPPGHEPEPDPVPERPVGPQDHLVRRGDTVYSIAFRNQLDYREVAKWNNIGSDYLIYPGQVLRLTPPTLAAVGAGDIHSQGIEDSSYGKPVAIGATPATGGGKAAPPPVPASTSSSPSRWVWPTDGVVVRGYAPAQGSKGLDFTGRVGQPVYASADGKVVYSGSALKGYGELIIVKHNALHLSAYGYNRSRLVKEGDEVKAGQKIAELGLGPENQPILHFEIREKGKPVNPVPFLPAKN